MGLEEIFRALKIKAPQFDVKEVIPTKPDDFWECIVSIDIDYGYFLAWFLSKIGF